MGREKLNKGELLCDLRRALYHFRDKARECCDDDQHATFSVLGDAIEQVIEELEVERFAETYWTTEDVLERKPDWTEEQAVKWLTEAEGTIQELMVIAGNEYVDYELGCDDEEADEE